MQWGLGESGDCVYFCLGVCPICTHGLRGWSRMKWLLYLLCPRPENISASKQSSIVSVLGQFISFCPRPKSNRSEMVSVLGIFRPGQILQQYSTVPSYQVQCVQCLYQVMFARKDGSLSVLCWRWTKTMMFVQYHQVLYKCPSQFLFLHLINYVN